MFQNKSALKQQFTAVTGCSSGEVTKWLEKSGWKLDVAIDAYLSNKTSSNTLRPDLKLVEIFESYKDNDGNGDVIGIDGTLRYLEDLGVDPDNSITLVLAYFLQSPSMGVFHRDTFLESWSRTNINTIDGMSQYLQNLYQTYKSDRDYFKKVYIFAFDFLMEVPGQRILSYDLAIDYWKLLFFERQEFEDCFTRLNQWFDFATNEYKRGFSKDTWQMFFLFLEDVIKKDPVNLSAYDEMAAWPSAIDEYIEYLRENDLVSF